MIVAVVDTSGQTGAVDYQFAVTPTGPASRLGSAALPISPPKYVVADEPPPTEPEKLALVMMVSRTNVRIGQQVKHTPARSRWLERVPLADDHGPAMRRIAELAAVAAAEETWAPHEVPLVLIGAERDVPLALLVEALSAAAGPGCVLEQFLDDRPHRCRFLGPVLHGGSPAPELGP